MTDTVIHQGDCREVMPTMARESVHCVVTSPPYYGLRDYGLGSEQIGLESLHDCMGWARGGENCHACYICHMREVFAVLWPVLRDDGTAWVNIADSYASSGGQGQPHRDSSGGIGNKGTRGMQPYPAAGGGFSRPCTIGNALKPKDLMGMPWRLAMALQADGWTLRSSIIWAKPNPMPESVTDRPTKSHEYVFLLSKRERYFYDGEAIRETATWGRKVLAHYSPKTGRKSDSSTLFRYVGDAKQGVERGVNQAGKHYEPSAGRNKRDVWPIATQPYPQAHFATMPIDLALTCIKAGTSLRGCCPACGAPWVRVVEQVGAMKTRNGPGEAQYHTHANGKHGSSSALTTGYVAVHETKGWQPSCACAHDPIPCTVFDPFGGAGTTAKAAQMLGRHAVLIEQKAEYIDLIRQRLRMHEELPGVSSNGNTGQLSMF